MSLIIKSSFKIDVPRAKAFQVLSDIETSVPCFPGAELGEKQPDGSYKGAFNVKLGPMAFHFAGQFGFIETRPEAGTAKVSASGNDTKGRGGARAIVDVSMTEDGASTKVDIVSDVTLSGPVAQYGRGTGMLQALSQQLINDFARNLSQAMASTGPDVTTKGVATTEIAALEASVKSVESKSSPHPASSTSAASLSATSLVWRAFMSWLRSKFKIPS
jgi:carbon monoxide dehydrogenase subunit G